MTEIHLFKNENIYNKLENLLSEKLGRGVEIKRTENGKPYAEGNPLFFSITHSGGHALAALSDKPVGADMEAYKKKQYPAVLSRFSERERAEINCEKDFLFHWTAREAFIKMLGGTLAQYFRRLEYFGGALYLDGVQQNLRIRAYVFYFGVACVVTEEN